MKTSTRMLSLLLLLSLLVFSGCSPQAEAPADDASNAGPAETSTEAAAPSDAGIVLALPSEPTTMHPVTSAERITFLPVNAIHDTLVWENLDTGEIEPRLAESWEISDDGLRYTFNIREGVKFHNGEDLTAEDVAFMLESVAENIPDNYGLIKNVEIEGDLKVSFDMEYAFSPMLYLLTHTQTCVVNKAYYEADPDGYGRNPNGTGPFKLSNWLSGESIELVRNDDYWRGPAPLKSVTFRVIAEEASKLIALEAGDIDAYIQVSQSNKPIIQDNPDLQWIEKSAGQVFTLAFNNGEKPGGAKSPFADNKALRQAICYAIDKDEIAALAIDNAAPALYTPFPNFIRFYPENFDGNVYDPEKAKEKLAEAGYPDGFKFTMKTTTQPIYSKPAEAIQGQLAKVGIEMELVQLERGTYLQEVYQDFDYDATVWAVSCDYPDMDSGAFKRFYSKNIKPAQNYMQINDPELDECIMINRTSQDDAERAAQVLRVCEIIRDESYGLPLYAAPNPMAVRSEIKGANINYGMMIDFYLWSK